MTVPIAIVVLAVIVLLAVAVMGKGGPRITQITRRRDRVEGEKGE
jgi:hypothetical protein